MDVPNVVRNEYTLVNVDDGFLNLMTGEGGEKSRFCWLCTGSLVD